AEAGAALCEQAQDGDAGRVAERLGDVGQALVGGGERGVFALDHESSRVRTSLLKGWRTHKILYRRYTINKVLLARGFVCALQGDQEAALTTLSPYARLPRPAS